MTSFRDVVPALAERVGNWGRWGDGDELGTLNFVTPEKRVQAAGLVRTGRIIDLGMPFDSHGPQPGGARFNPIHLMSALPATGPAGSDHADPMIASDDVIVMPLQAATQWDSLAHAGYDGYFYNRTPASSVTAQAGATRNSFDKVCSRLISRGVLLDIPRLRGVDRLERGEEVTADDLSAAEEAQGVRVESGDILLVRTGWYRWFLEGDSARYIGLPGADGVWGEPGLGLSTLEWIHAREAAAVASDTSSVEVHPSGIDGAGSPFHMVALRDMGLTLGEMFDLEDLAADCAADGVWEFLLCATGLKVTNSVGSPITPMAVK